MIYPSPFKNSNILEYDLKTTVGPYLIEDITDTKRSSTFVDKFGKGHRIEDFVHEVILGPIPIPEELRLEIITRKLISLHSENSGDL